MKILIKSCYLLCLVLCGLTGNAQQQWKAAKLVTSGSDTIQGQLNFEDWDQSPTSIQFKDALGNITSKSAQEIQSFSIQEPLKTFESKSLVLSYYKKTIVEEGASPIESTDSGTFFLEVLLKSSKVTFYRYGDNQMQTRFFLQKDDKLHELRNPVYRLAKGETSHIVRSEVYKAQLKQLLFECPTLNTERLSYADKEIVDLLVKYHSYCKAEYSLESHQENLGQRFAIGGIYRYAAVTDYSVNYVGLNALLFSKKKFNSVFVSIDLGYAIGLSDEYSTEDKMNLVCFGLYGGKYFGLGEWHPMVFTGISNTNGGLDTGVGLSYQRIFAISSSIGIIHLTKGNAVWAFHLRLTPFSNKQ